MCGLFASIGLEPDRSRIDIVSHRGPDGSGWRVFDSPAGPLALGHRRLAIIDTSDAGLQPMADESGRYWLLLNGEIYNYLELRAELEARGETFRTESDSEVLLRAYMVWGAAALDRLIGMFAFLVWDDREKTLFAARDRFGIKPLYCVITERSAAFASEIKQLLDLPGSSRRINLARAHDFLAGALSDHTAETLFEGVRQLAPGEYAECKPGRAGALNVKFARWYGNQPPPRLVLSADDAAQRFRELLDDSVRLHLRADVPTGSCLSGGLDSSSIVSLMSARLKASPGSPRAKTVSACYAEKEADERPFIESVLSATGAESHLVFPRAEDVFDQAGEITWHQDEPFGSTSIFAQWTVFAEARRQGVKVMLDGQGADEQLAGYHFGFPLYYAHLFKRGRLLALARTLIERQRVHGAAIPRQLVHLALALAPRPLLQLARGSRQKISQHGWLDSEIFRDHAPGKTAQETAAETAGLPLPHDVASLCQLMTRGSNLQMLLHWEDRNSMAHGIEARVPFLDHRLVEFSLGLGNSHKFEGADTKRVLRQAMADMLPRDVAERRDKLGFATPEQRWLRGPLKQLAHEGVEFTLSRLPGLLHAPGVRALRDDMLEGRKPADFTLWRIISLGIWAEKFKVSLN